MTETATQLQPLPLDLVRPFCSPELISKRWSAPEPFVFRGWLYAVQHAVCVRVPATGHPDSPASNRPPVEDLFKTFPELDRFTNPWPQRDEESFEVPVGSHLIGIKFLNLVATLPNVRHAIVRQHDRPLPFIFDGGGQGVVVGLRKD